MVVTLSSEVACADPWFRIGAPNLTDLHALRLSGRKLTPLEVLAYVEADLHVRDDDTVVFEEPTFQVAELAHALTSWVRDGIEPDDDFELESVSYAEIGAIRIVRADDGWVAGSRFVETTTQPRPWDQVRESIEAFVEDAQTITALSLLAVGWSMIETSMAMLRTFGLPFAEIKPLVIRASGQAREIERLHDALESAARDLPHSSGTSDNR